MFYVHSSPILRQYLVILIVNLNMVCLGLSVAWPSPMLVKLKDGTGLPRPITDEEGSWIVSISILSSIPNSIPVMNITQNRTVFSLVGLLMDKIGRKTTLLLGFIPRLAVGLILLFASEVWVVILARGIDGIVTNALAIATVPTYASEVASKEIRGVLGTSAQIASATGMLIFFGIAPFLPYFYVNLLSVCLIIAAGIPMWFVPESPYYLYSKGRKEVSIKVLTYLRGSENLALEEIKDYDIALNRSTKLSCSEIFKDRVTLKTIGKVLLLSFLAEATGYNAVLMYLMEILRATQTSINDNIASVVIGFMQLIACFCTISMTDKFGRKPILTTTLAGTAIGMLCLGTFFKLKDQDYQITGFLNVLPLLSLILIIFCYNAGLGSLFCILIAELFDGPARAVGVSIAFFNATIWIFLLTKYFVSVTLSIGPALIYWIFGIFCVTNALFIMFFIPETKAKTFLEIQMELGRSSTKNVK